MKTTFKIIVIVLVAAFYGCQKSDVSPGVNGSISNDGVLTGTIVNDSNRIDSIKAYDNSSIILGKSAVSSSEKFSLVLTNPVLSRIGTAPSGVVVSDTTAIIGNMDEFEAYKGGIYTGNINKTNFNISDSTKAGESASQFIYSDRTFTIKGTEIHVDTYSNFKSNLKVNYSITFKKGWNETVLKVDSYSNTTIATTTVETYSNTVTSDLQWKYSPFNTYNFTIRAKTRGILGVARQRFLFQ